MAERTTPDVVTLADFLARATSAAGGTEELSRRMGISTRTLESMSASGSPMLDADATALFDAFGLSLDDQ